MYSIAATPRSRIATILLSLALLCLDSSHIKINCNGETFHVSTTSELLSAFHSVNPGDTISLMDGNYTGQFVIERNGKLNEEIILQGSSHSCLKNPIRSGDPNDGSGFGLWLKASNWILEQFTVADSVKGIIIDNGHNNTLRNVSVIGMDDEGIHFRFGSSDNLVINCLVDDTGRVRPGYGEGVYVGQDNKKWENFQPDKCDRNKIIGNHFGENVRSEGIDIKEGTCCGRIANNYFDGRGMTNKLWDDSWIDVKGDYYIIEDNVGNWSLKDGFQVSDHMPPESERFSGCYNLFQRNTCRFQNDNMIGYCVYFNSKGNCNNTVSADNIYINGHGLTNGAL